MTELLVKALPQWTECIPLLGLTWRRKEQECTLAGSSKANKSSGRPCMTKRPLGQVLLITLSWRWREALDFGHLILQNIQHIFTTTILSWVDTKFLTDDFFLSNRCFVLNMTVFCNNVKERLHFKKILNMCSYSVLCCK